MATHYRGYDTGVWGLPGKALGVAGTTLPQSAAGGEMAQVDAIQVSLY